MPETTLPVSLHYTLNADDWIDGIIAHHDHVRIPWLLKPPRLIVGLVVIAGLVLVAILPDTWWLGACYILLGLLLYLRPRRRQYRRYSRRLVADNPAWHHPTTVEFSEEGIVAQNPSIQARNGWNAWGYFAETDRIFLLLMSDQRRTAMQVIPKRGLAEPGDARRLAELLDRHLVRLHRRGRFR